MFDVYNPQQYMDPFQPDAHGRWLSDSLCETGAAAAGK